MQLHQNWIERSKHGLGAASALAGGVFGYTACVFAGELQFLRPDIYFRSCIAGSAGGSAAASMESVPSFEKAAAKEDSMCEVSNNGVLTAKARHSTS